MEFSEKNIVIFFNRRRNRFLDHLSELLSSVSFLVLLWIVLAGFFYLFAPNNGIKLDSALALVFLMHFAISEGVFKWGARKLGIARKRPYKKHSDEIKPIGKLFSDSSFPSSHVSAMVSASCVVVNFYHSLLWIFLCANILLAWSRMKNGMHYPSDILAGIVLGLLYGEIALKIINLF